jgi:hypothetical protein
MKKLIAILAFAGLSSVAIAQDSVSVGYQRQTVDAGGAPDQYQTSLAVKHGFGNGVAVDFGLAAAQNNDANVAASSSKVYKDTTRVEAGVSYQKAIFGPVDGYARLGLGQKAPSGTEAFWYHSQEVGVVGHLPYGFDAKLGYRWRQELSNGTSSQVDTSQTLRMGLAYNIDKKNVISLNRDNVQANTANGGDTTAYNIMYTYKF